jgi:hypothetical protein
MSKCVKSIAVIDILFLFKQIKMQRNDLLDQQVKKKKENLYSICPFIFSPYYHQNNNVKKWFVGRITLFLVKS